MTAVSAELFTNRWRAAASPGGLIGILAAIVCLLLAGGSLAVILGKASLPIPMGAVWAGLIAFLALAGGLAYLVYGYLSITYELGEQTLVIGWANRRYALDLATIQHIGPASEVLEERPERWQPFWPGYYIGTHTGKIGPVRVVATLPLSRQLLVSTGDRHFAISPERPVLFLEEYGRLRRALDEQRSGAFPTIQEGEGARQLKDAGWTVEFPTLLARPKTPEMESPHGETDAGAGSVAKRGWFIFPEGISPVLRPLLLNDPIALGLLGIAVLLNVVMVAYILLQYDSIPSSITLHWNVNGFPDRIGSPREIWIVPLITGMVTIANFLLAWSIVTFDRFAARLLLGATCLVQLVAWVALITLIR